VFPRDALPRLRDEVQVVDGAAGVRDFFLQRPLERRFRLFHVIVQVRARGGEKHQGSSRDQSNVSKPKEMGHDCSSSKRFRWWYTKTAKPRAL